MFARLYLFAIDSLNLNPLPHPDTSSGITNIISIVISVTAAVSLLMIVIGGVRYILSRGEPQAVQRAKGTVIYAVVGLVIAVMAQVIVTFVLRSTS